MEKFSGCLGSDSFPRKRQGKHPWTGVPNHRGQLCAEDKAGSFYSMVKVILLFEIYKLQRLKENVLLVCVLVSFPIAMITRALRQASQGTKDLFHLRGQAPVY